MSMEPPNGPNGSLHPADAPLEEPAEGQPVSTSDGVADDLSAEAGGDALPVLAHDPGLTVPGAEPAEPAEIGPAAIGAAAIVPAGDAGSASGGIPLSVLTGTAPVIRP